MNKQELEEWGLETFWPTYKALCSTPFVNKWKGGARGEAVAKIVTMAPSNELRERIMSSLNSQIIHRNKLYADCGSAQRYESKTKFNKFYTNRNGSTWLHNRGWNDEIPSISEQISGVQKEGDTCACGEPVDVLYLNVCAKCYVDKHTDSKKKLYDNLVKRGMGKKENESKAEYIGRIKNALGVQGDRLDILDLYQRTAESRDKRSD